jgi:hypothetical protein
MQVFIIRAEHWSTSGSPTRATLDADLAAAEAFALVNALRADFDSDDEIDMLPMEPGSDWKAGLVELQRALIGDDHEDTLESIDKDEHPWGYESAEDFYLQVSECGVWIEAIDLILPEPLNLTPEEEIALQPAVTNAMLGACINATHLTQEGAAEYGAKVAARLAEIMPPMEDAATAKVYAATIHHKHGVNLILAGSEAERTAKLADYCRERWIDAIKPDRDEDGEALVDPVDLRDDHVIEVYFDPEHMGEHEYVELYPPEDVAPPPIAHTPMTLEDGDIVRLSAMQGKLLDADNSVIYDHFANFPDEPPACTHCGEPRASNPCEHCNGFDGGAA